MTKVIAISLYYIINECYVDHFAWTISTLHLRSTDKTFHSDQIIKKCDIVFEISLTVFSGGKVPSRQAFFDPIDKWSCWVSNQQPQRSRQVAVLFYRAMGVRRGGQGGLLKNSIFLLVLRQKVGSCPPPPGNFLPSPGKNSADAHV
jgi:hypothetical protein